MTEYTPSIEECRDAYITATMGYTKSVSRYEALGALFDRMIAEIKRTASAKGWDEGREHGYNEGREYHGFGHGCGPDTWDCDCPNPYRRNEGENE